MLSHITAADMLHHHEVEQRDRELSLLASIRERVAARAAEPAPRHAALRASRVTPRAARTTWARPIGAQTTRCAQPAACATA